MEAKPLTRPNYEIGQELGRGAFSRVYTANYKVEKKSIQLAVKIINKKKSSKHYLKKFLPREVEVLSQISHEHIIRTHSILNTPSKVFIFMEYAPNGDVYDFIYTNGSLEERKARFWFVQLTSAVHYLHELHVVHRDIKCENLLITKRMNVKLTDFSFTRIMGEGNNAYSRTFCGTPAYVAPEIIQKKKYLPEIADIWSMGVVLFVITSGYMPFDQSGGTTSILTAHKGREYRNHFSELSLGKSLRSLLDDMLEPNPRDRMNMEDLINHPWLHGKVAKIKSEEEDASTATPPKAT